MKVYGIDISEKKGLTNFDLIRLASVLKINNFHGVFMRNDLLNKPNDVDCWIFNLNKKDEQVSHWVCYLKNENKRIYFDSFG